MTLLKFCIKAIR